MRIFITAARHYGWPLIKLVTFFPRLILRGAFSFFMLIINGYVAAGIIIMATVFPFCVIALFFAHDTTPYWNGIGFSLAALAWAFVVAGLIRLFSKIKDRALRAIHDVYRPAP